MAIEMIPTLLRLERVQVLPPFVEIYKPGMFDPTAGLAPDPVPQLPLLLLVLVVPIYTV
jgi:hypothetical protein